MLETVKYDGLPGRRRMEEWGDVRSVLKMTFECTDSSDYNSVNSNAQCESSNVQAYVHTYMGVDE